MMLLAVCDAWTHPFSIRFLPYLEQAAPICAGARDSVVRRIFKLLLPL